MIGDAYWVWMLAVSDNQISSTITIRIPTKTVTAQVSIAREVDLGKAFGSNGSVFFSGSYILAYIQQYCTLTEQGFGCQGFKKGEEPSILTVENATSITFQTDVFKASAVATGLILLHA